MMSRPLSVHLWHNYGCVEAITPKCRKHRERGERLHDNTEGTCCWAGEWRGGREVQRSRVWYISIDQIPSCMPCMSFLVFEAFSLGRKKIKQRNTQLAKCRNLRTSVQGFDYFLTDHSPPFSWLSPSSCFRLRNLQVPDKRALTSICGMM